MFFLILIFDPYRQFCKMAHFKNGLISAIFGVFLAVFCGRFFHLGYSFVFSGDWQKVMELIFLVLENAVTRIVNC